MTLIAIACHGDRAEIATDHFTLLDYGRHTGTLPKVLTLSHLGAAVTVQGDQITYGELGFRLAMSADLTNFDSLVDHVAQILPDLWQSRWERTPETEPYDTTCYLVGHSHLSGRYEAFALPSAHDFERTDLTDDLFVFPAPLSEQPSSPTTSLQWRDLVGLVHAERSLDVLDTGRKVPTGGPVILTTIQPGSITQETILELPTSGPVFHQMMQGFNHPSSQLAPCPCGSEQPVIACHDNHDDLPCDCGSALTFAECCRVDPDTSDDDPCPCGRPLRAGDCCAPHLVDEHLASHPAHR